MTQRDLPCTPMQAGLVFEALAGGAGTYLQQSIIRLHEPVDVAALRRAWEGVVARNWALRSSFAVGAEAAPTLRVEDGLEVPLVVLDWTDREGAAQEERFAELLWADRATGFDPAAPPLMRLVLCRLGPTESRLVWSYHHAIIDGRSRVLILRELFDAYEGRDATADRPGPDAFAAFARWTNERAGDAEALAFWEHALRHASPTPSPRRPDPPEEPGARSLQLSRPLSDALRAFAEAHDLTLATVLQGAFALVLGQETGLTDLVYGTTRAGRRSAPMPTDAMVGMLMATTPVRARIDPGQALVDWLRRPAGLLAGRAPLRARAAGRDPARLRHRRPRAGRAHLVRVRERLHGRAARARHRPARAPELRPDRQRLRRRAPPRQGALRRGGDVGRHRRALPRAPRAGAGRDRGVVPGDARG